MFHDSVHWRVLGVKWMIDSRKNVEKNWKMLLFSRDAKADALTERT